MRCSRTAIAKACGTVVCLALIAFAVGNAAPARADTPATPDSPDLPWTNPDHRSSLELLLGTIASHIAGREVTVRCEGESDWFKLAVEGRADPDSELGFIRGVAYDRTTGQLLTLPNYVELNGTKICLPLKTFAVATSKPTKCATMSITPKKSVKVRERARRVVVIHGKSQVKTIWITRTVVRPERTTIGPPASCYLGSTNVARMMSTAYWADYSRYAEAMLTLAHESIHLSGVVGGRLSNGVQAGVPNAEAKATCYGMQWMPYVAEQLGDTSGDALAIAQFFWDFQYPRIQTGPNPQYWSADCKPGGAMDVRLAGTTDWP